MIIDGINYAAYKETDSSLHDSDKNRLFGSDRALIMLAATDESFAHDGINPQRIKDSSRTGSFGFWRMTGTGWVGAML